VFDEMAKFRKTRSTRVLDTNAAADEMARVQKKLNPLDMSAADCTPVSRFLKS